MDRLMRLKKGLIFLQLFFIVAASAFCVELALENWLVVKAKTFKPAFTEESSSLLSNYSLDFKSLWPRDGDSFLWDPQQALAWKDIKAKEGKLLFSSEKETYLIIATTYIDFKRWQRASLSFQAPFPFRVFIDGELVDYRENEDLTFTRGKHRLLIAAVQEQTKNGILKACLKFEDKYQSTAPIISTDPTHNVSLLEILTIPQVIGLEMSPDGSRVAILDNLGKLEIRLIPDGKLIQTLLFPGRISHFSWSPEGNRLAVATIGEETLSDLWVVNLKIGDTAKLFAKIKSITQLNWLPDGKHISFATTEKIQRNAPYDLVDNFFDRWEGWKNKVFLWMASIESRTMHVISGGLNPYGFLRDAIISPDGKKVVFIYETPSSSYPYSHKELWLVDILTGKSEFISEIKTSFIQKMIWSPDSSQLAVIAPYNNFPKSPEETLQYHSSWHWGIQLWDVSKKNYRYLTKPEFNPSVWSLWWNPKDNKLNFIAWDRTVLRLYRFSSDFKEFSEVKLPFNNIQAIFGGKNSEWVVLRVAAIERPSWYVSLNLETIENKIIWDKGRESLLLVQPGKHEMFYCKNREGTQLDGWLLLPPDFDSKKKYPLVVSYYAGVGPKNQSYEADDDDIINHWLAGNGYIVYMLTPRGAWGFGQKFADAHINEWGTTSSPDIIDAVNALIKDKPYINPNKIGGLGHSYGGFEGLSLITKTNLFACMIATGVISNTLNYSFIILGHKNYGEIGLPGIYPWNRKDIYVDRSPVFNADKVTTPVLLMQGTDDIWCQMNESDQIYSALKVQGKDVVQIRWIGEGHSPSQFANIILWNQIRLEWFDKYLKDEPESWQDRYDKGTK
jgi:dipeptidyl aminopeptidase/acylaminoacyl peptidase